MYVMREYVGAEDTIGAKGATSHLANTAHLANSRRFTRSAGTAILLCAAALAITTLSTSFGLKDKTPRARMEGSFSERGGPIELSQRFRGHELKVGTSASSHHTHGHIPVSPHAPHVPAAHKSAAAPSPPPPLTPAQKAKLQEENELWKTEQAMKAKLDASDAAKGEHLWQQTLGVVHKHDPNAALIAKLSKQGDLLDGPKHAPQAHHSRGDRHPTHTHPSSDSSSTKSAAPVTDTGANADMVQHLKEQLQESVTSKMKNNYDSIKKSEQSQLSKISKHSQLASIAQGQHALSVHALKQNLRNKLNTQTHQKLDGKKTKAQEAAAKNAHESTSEALADRLKEELDNKTKEEQKKMLLQETARKRLSVKRKKLAGNLKRALKVREQLTEEMKEQNTIRSQLDKEAKIKGKQMLEKKLPASVRAARGKAVPAAHMPTRSELERQLRASLRKEEGKQRNAPHPHTATSNNKEGKEAQQLLSHPATHAHLESELRNQLDAAAAKQKQELLSKAVTKNSLLAGVEQLVTHMHKGSVTSKKSAIDAAELRLFKASMAEARTSERRASETSNLASR